jgi:predicted nucleic acid-binding protein
MPIVSNTSPILNLSIIGKLSILQRQFGEVWIPAAVHKELKLDSNLPGVADIQTALESGWLKVAELKNTQLSRVLAKEIDQGEAEAIGLALEVNAETIIMDEHEGRETVKSLGLSPIGILGLLLKEKKDGKLLSILEVMNELREKAGFFINKDLYNEIIMEAQEA